MADYGLGTTWTLSVLESKMKWMANKIFFKSLKIVKVLLFPIFIFEANLLTVQKKQIKAMEHPTATKFK